MLEVNAPLKDKPEVINSDPHGTWMIVLTLDNPSETRGLMVQAGIREIPLTGDIAILAVQLNLHGDPADRFIVATAIAKDATLMTADETLLRWRSKLRRINAEQ